MLIRTDASKALFYKTETETNKSEREEEQEAETGRTRVIRLEYFKLSGNFN